MNTGAGAMGSTNDDLPMLSGAAYGMPHGAISLLRAPDASAFDSRKIAKAHLVRQVEGVLGTDAAIWELEIHPTNFCNLACAGCSYSDRHDKATIDPEKLVSLIRHLCRHDLRSIFVSGGGDPALWRDWEKVFRNVDCSGLAIGVSTNLSSWARISRVIDLISYFQIHLVGFDEESCLRETGRSCFSSIDRNLTLLLESVGQGQEVTIKVLVRNENYAQIHRFLDYISRLSPNAVVLKLQQNFTTNRPDFESESIDVFRRMVIGHPIVAQYAAIVDNLDDGMFRPPRGEQATCSFAASSLYRLVTADGKLYPCVASTYSQTNACGQISDLGKLQDCLDLGQPGPIYLANCPLQACRHYRASLLLDSVCPEVHDSVQAYTLGPSGDPVLL